MMPGATLCGVRVRVLVASSVLIVLGSAAACGYEPVDGDNLVLGNKLPDRPDAGGTDADAGNSGAIPDPISDAAPDVKPPSQTCVSADLALCFTFEGLVNDQSSAPLAPKTVLNVTFVPGKEGMAASFNAMSAIRFDPAATFELPPEGATIEAWIKRQNAGADAVVFDDDGRFSLTINAAGHVWCKGGGQVIGTKVVPVDQWAHVACVIDKGAMRAYLNGVQDGESTGAVGSAPTLAAAIGGNSPDGEPFLGLIDSFRVFRVARTPAQIAASAQE
jgi:hypothetical protein